MNELLALLLQGILGSHQPQTPLVSPVPQNGLQAHNIPALTVNDLIAKYFPEDPKTAQAVFTQESQLGKYFQPTNGDPTYGVAQISLPAHRSQIPGINDTQKIDWLRDPENNLKIARQLYDASGWNPWGAYTSGAYKKYLQ